jgi:hypothetical protein
VPASDPEPAARKLKKLLPIGALESGDRYPAQICAFGQVNNAVEPTLIVGISRGGARGANESAAFHAADCTQGKTGKSKGQLPYFALFCPGKTGQEI